MTLRYSLLSVALSASLLLSSSCDRCVYDDLTSCPQGVAFRFTAQTPCGDDLQTFSDDVHQLQVQVYDASTGAFVTAHDASGIDEIRRYVLTTSFAQPGRYEYAVWGTTPPAPYSRTSGAEAMAFKGDRSQPLTTDLPPLYYGRLPRVHEIIDRSELGTLVDTLTVNLLPLTIPVTVSVTNLERGGEYTLYLEDQNGSFDRHGHVLDPASKAITYTRPMHHAPSSHTTMEASATIFRPQGEGLGLTLEVLDAQGMLVKGLPTWNEIISELSRVASSKGDAFRWECLERLDIHIELPEKIDPSMRIIVKVNEWNLVIRRVALGSE